MTANSNVPKMTKSYKDALLTGKKIEKIREEKRVKKNTEKESKRIHVVIILYEPDCMGSLR